ncbi:MAG TPA: Ku protein [Methylomirabilota bacterium]|nr:Ku protein [Methylomirabilota bacterium]
MATHRRRTASHRNGGRRTDDAGDGRNGGRSPRAIWKGAVSFGLVTVPVGLYAATAGAHELSFRLLHKKDLSPVDYKRFCKEEDVEIPWSDIVKGYEYAKGRYVVVTDEDFARARVAATQTFEIRDFVPAASVGDFYFDHPYYLAPAGKPAVKPYALLRDALAKSGRVGVGTIVLRQREHLAALEPAGDTLVLTTMRWSHEIRSPEALDVPKRNAGWDRREMDLALRLIDTLASEFDPRRYTDTYRDVMLKVIEAKVKGEELEMPAPERPKNVRSLMKALEASLRERRPPARAAARGRKPAEARRREARAA